MKKEYLKEMWDLQVDLISKYQEIGALPETYPLDLSEKESQNLIRSLAGFLVEELAEAYDASFEDENQNHFNEEMIDSLHFLLEIAVFTFKDFEEFYSHMEGWLKKESWLLNKKDLSHIFWEIVFELSMAVNLLKAKPWRRTGVPVDNALFLERVSMAFALLLRSMDIHNFTQEGLLNRYKQKNLINQQRIKEKY